MGRGALLLGMRELGRRVCFDFLCFMYGIEGGIESGIESDGLKAVDERRRSCARRLQDLW